MGQETFRAGTQYGDFKGSAAADRHDHADISDYLEQRGLIKEGEQVFATELYSGEVHTVTQDSKVYVTVMLATGEGYDDIKAAIDSGEPLKVRKVRLEMHLNEFFGLFKRFNICISNHGLLENKEIQFDD
ncbi:hypothetical protein [Comamonas testosteroni]|uniref:Uncharacterized protein n=1 Tax=Comamonas testosteroni TaxID=285 RepID=A0A096GRL8_COMTE|nr:hypothetical protein [Comamonas testosteroni]KGH27845.1 hypothetical protein P353_16990 [Comamonas testosteroni]